MTAHFLNQQSSESKNFSDELQPLRAVLRGSDTCTCLDIDIVAHAPVLELCRELLAAGGDPDRALDVYRGNVLAMRIRSIGAAAALEINADGTGFRLARKADTAPPVRFQTSSLGGSLAR